MCFQKNIKSTRRSLCSASLHTHVFLLSLIKKKWKKEGVGGKGGGKETDCFAIAWHYVSSIFIGVEGRQQCQSNSGFSGWCSPSPCGKSDVNNYLAVECAERERGGGKLNLHASLQWPLKVLAWKMHDCPCIIYSAMNRISRRSDLQVKIDKFGRIKHCVYQPSSRYEEKQCFKCKTLLLCCINLALEGRAGFILSSTPLPSCV